MYLHFTAQRLNNSLSFVLTLRKKSTKRSDPLLPSVLYCSASEVRHLYFMTIFKNFIVQLRNICTGGTAIRP